MAAKPKPKPSPPDAGQQQVVRHLLFGLIRWAHAYYELDEHWVDDTHWDQQFAILKLIENTNSQLVAPYSPSVNVGCSCPECKPKLWPAADKKAFKAYFEPGPPPKKEIY